MNRQYPLGRLRWQLNELGCLKLWVYEDCLLEAANQDEERGETPWHNQ